MASRLLCDILSSGKLRLIHLKAKLGTWGNDSWHPPFLSRPRNSPSQRYLLYVDPYALLTCLPRDCICPFYNFILTSNLKLLLRFPPGLEWSSTPTAYVEQRKGLAWPWETCPSPSSFGCHHLQCGGVKKEKKSPLPIWLKYFTVTS